MRLTRQTGCYFFHRPDESVVSFPWARSPDTLYGWLKDDFFRNERPIELYLDILVRFLAVGTETAAYSSRVDVGAMTMRIYTFFFRNCVSFPSVEQRFSCLAISQVDFEL